MKKVKTRKLFTGLLLFLAVLCISVSFGGVPVKALSTSVTKPSTVSGGTFIKNPENKKQWSYRYKDKTLARKVFLSIKGKTYYFNSYGYRWYGLRTIKGKTYYFGTKDEGFLYKNKWIKYKGKYYCLSKDGYARTGWVRTSSGRRFYLDKTGAAVTGNQTIDGVSYYFSSKGILIRTGQYFDISADCALLMNARTGKIVYAKNDTQTHANASTTKIMTCILALENCKLTEKVKVSAYAASQEPTKLYMQAGDSFYLKDLLYSLMLPSHNDTAVAIAEHISGSVPKFASLMNKKAKEIGCTNTHFVTPNGLDAGLNHYTTAQDIAKIAQYALENATFRKIVNTRSYSFSSLNGRYYYVYTTNALLGNMKGVIGVKTGFTNKAKYCFVGAITSKSKDTYISVILGAPNSSARWTDSQTLLNYASKL